MVRPPSLLAELRSLESRREQGALSPKEEARLAELRAVAGPMPSPRGFDVNAAAAASRDSLVPAGLGARRPEPPVSLPPVEPPPVDFAPVEAEPDVAPIEAEPMEAEPLEVLQPGAEIRQPETEPVEVPPFEAGPLEVPQPEAEPVEGPRFEAEAIEVPAREAEPLEPPLESGSLPPLEGMQFEMEAPPGDAPPEAPLEVLEAEPLGHPGEWEPGPASSGDLDPTAPWDPDAVAARWDAAISGLDPRPAAPGASLDPAPAPAWDLGLSGIESLPETGGWQSASGAAGKRAWRPPPSARHRENQTAAWDLSGAASPAMVVPDETDAGATAVWKVSDVAGRQMGAGSARLPPASPWSADPEIALLDELTPESGGSFSPLFEDPAAPLPGGPPLAVPEIPPAAYDEIPEVEAVELVEDAPAAVEPEPSPAALEPPPGQDLPGSLGRLGDFFEAAEPAPAPPPDAPVYDASDDVVEVPPVPAEDLAPPEPPVGEIPDLPEPPAPEAEAVPIESLEIQEVLPEVPEPAPAQRGKVIPGLHRVVVHTVDGLVRRGTLQDPDLEAAELRLLPQPAAAEEHLSADRVRAIFFMLAAGEKAPPPEGSKVRVTFRDGRQVAGFSPDYDPAATGFFMIPADTRTNTARIWVYRNAVRQITLS